MQKNLEQILNVILHTSEMLEEDMKQESDLKNLTTRQLNCIELVKNMKNPTLSELAQKLNITKPSTSVMLDRLKEHGYLIRVKSDNDRRSAHVHLTDKGEKAAQVHTEVHEEIAKQLSKELTVSEKEILIVLLNKAIQSFTK